MAAAEITSRFGASVRNLRHRLGISQEALAERADLHRTYIAGIEGGVRNVTLKSIDKLARALQVSTATLLLNAGGPDERGQLAIGESSTGKRVDILVVEDDPKDVELTSQAFKQARITNSVQVVHDGTEALDFLFCTGRFIHRKIEDRPQLVLLDLSLPKVGGVEVLRRIKANERTQAVHVVVLTALRDTEKLAECLRWGAETFIVKPLDFQRLSEATPQLNLSWELIKPVKTRMGTFRA
jgi:CheY-like chemotaxis protein/DNA-binding XRE family transcriptional regulator